MKGCDDEVKNSEYIYSKKCKNKGFPNGVQMVFALKIQKYIDKIQRNKKKTKINEQMLYTNKLLALTIN